MSIDSDLAFNQRACDLAVEAVSWFAKNQKISSPELNGPIDFGDEVDAIWYIQSLVDGTLKFGYRILKKGAARTSNASLSPLKWGDAEYWTMCLVVDHTTDEDAILLPGARKDILVHEFVHYLDFTTHGHRPRYHEGTDFIDLGDRYYSTPHEFNAFYHQGLYQFLADLPLVEIFYRRGLNAGRPTRNQFFSRMLHNDAYWPSHFVRSLSGKYARKFRRRCFQVFDRYLPR